MLAEYDDDGNRVWLRHFPGEEWLSLSRAWVAPDGDIAILGEANGPGTIGVPGGTLPVDADDVLFMLRLR